MFYRSASIKKVFPDLIPKPNYSDLAKEEAGAGSYTCHLNSTGRIPVAEVDQLCNELIIYYTQNSMRMVNLWNWKCETPEPSMTSRTNNLEISAMSKKK